MLFTTGIGPLVGLAGKISLNGLVSRMRDSASVKRQPTAAETLAMDETSFFRDPNVFEMLRRDVMPRLIARRSEERRLRIWSAGSSTGQEAFSVAMMLRESFPELAGWDVNVMGTDISETSIAYARRGRYTHSEVRRGLPEVLRARYMEEAAMEFTVCDTIRAMCEFETSDLLSPAPFSPAPQAPVFDLVLLRNVVPFFSQEEWRGVFRGVHRQTAADGYLILGSSEHVEDSTDLFRCEERSESHLCRPKAAY